MTNHDSALAMTVMLKQVNVTYIDDFREKDNENFSSYLFHGEGDNFNDERIWQSPPPQKNSTETGFLLYL